MIIKRTARRSAAVAVVACMALPQMALSAVIAFGEFAPQNVNGAIPAATYADWGVTFAGTDDGSTWGGNSAGNPGAWGVQGTNGAAFSGYNGASYSNALSFDRDVRSVTLDVTRTSGSDPGESFTLEGYRNGVLVESRTVTLGGVDTWKTVTLFSTVDEVRWAGSGGSLGFYAVDNLSWTNQHTSRVIFDEYAPQNVNGVVSGDYSALGATFGGTDDGSTWGGTALGNPGAWSVDGTVGSVFSGYNGASYGNSVAFDTTVANVAVDVARSAGSTAGDSFTLEGWKNGVLVESRTVTFGAVDQWQTVVLDAQVDEVRWSGSGAGAAHPFAVDNLNWTDARSGVIRFDEFAADNLNGTIPSNRYASRGVTFVGTDDGSTWGGISNGNPGAWGLEGTNGAIFAGFNGASNGLTMLFDGIIGELSLDVARSAGSTAGDLFTMEGWLNGILVASRTVLLPEVGTWLNFTLDGAFDSVTFFGTQGGIHPYGIDNIAWTWIERNGETATVPAPAGHVLGLSGIGLLALVGLKRKGRRNRRPSLPLAAGA